jgi:phosphoglycerol transferase MdoB-like AlkP superfamily enzyme
MNTHSILIRFALIAGLLIAPLAWAIDTQLGEILPYLDCQHQGRSSAIAAFTGMLLACLAAIISWRSSSRTRSAGLLTGTFLGRLSALSALVFAFALSLQGIASLVLSGCER